MTRWLRRLGAPFGERFLVLVARLLGRVLTGLFAISLAFFALQRIVPGNPATALAGPGASADAPLPAQYLGFLRHLAEADLGVSARTHQPVTGEMIAALPATLELLVAASLGGLLIGIAAALIGRAGGAARVPRAALALAGALPVYALAMLLLLTWYFLRHLPGGASVEIGARLAVPAAALGLPVAFVVANAMSFELEAAARQTYFRAARAAGSTALHAARQHGLRNALRLPLASFGVQFGVLLASLPVVERLFDRAGLGAYLAQALAAHDLPASLGVTMAFATAYLVVDVAMAVLRAIVDPRLRLE